jgi:transposase-like protein
MYDPVRDRIEEENARDPKCHHKHFERVGTCSEGCCDRYICYDCAKYFLLEVGD